MTGHQPWLWHPGILTKYLLADAAHSRLERSSPIPHVVVDQDIQDTLRLDLPIQLSDVLRVETIHLGQARVDVPTGCQPPTPLSLPAEDLPGLAVDLQPLREAVEQVEAMRWGGDDQVFRTLAEQMSALLALLMNPYLDHELEPIFASQLFELADFKAVVDGMLADAERCISLYNRAVSQRPSAGVAKLLVEPFRVELPLWKLGWLKPRERVYADLADSTPLLTTAAGEPIDTDNPQVQLAPRALLLTAWLRSRHPICVFIHGTGGGVYDRITEQWWSDWRGETLAPLGVATADLHLQFDAPSASQADLQHAVWYRHHLPHNLDRELQLSGSQPDEKQQLLSEMDRDRDAKRRRTAFLRLQEINGHFQREHNEAIEAAQTALDRTRLGLTNAQIVKRRDWCFAIHPPESLNALRLEIARSVSS